MILPHTYDDDERYIYISKHLKHLNYIFCHVKGNQITFSKESNSGVHIYMCVGHEIKHMLDDVIFYLYLF
jgi:hypothetical protein